MGLNKVTLIGNVGKNPEFYATKDGKNIAVFNLATTESWKDKASGEKREETEWHRIVIYSEGLVEIVRKYVHKGTKLFIEGKVKTKKWMDSSGSERRATEVVLQNHSAQLMLLDSKNADKNFSDDSISENEGPDEFSDDKIPF